MTDKDAAKVLWIALLALTGGIFLLPAMGDELLELPWRGEENKCSAKGGPDHD